MNPILIKILKTSSKILIDYLITILTQKKNPDTITKSNVVL